MLSSFWNDLLRSLSGKEQNIPILFSLLKQLRPLELTDKKIVLGCNNQGVRFFLERKIAEVEEVVFQFSGKKLSVELAMLPQKKVVAPPPLLQFEPSTSDLFMRAGLHPKYSFDNFAVSSSNQVAYAAAQAITKTPGHSYNPLFLYGGVGVGKTHLAQAVAKKILEQDGSKKVYFCPGDHFTNDLIESIRERATPRFRRKYRYLHLLIIDDVQFIAGKETVQEEFFHTFNSLVSAGGQVILTADRPPHEITGLEDRLRSRFSGGLIVDIQSPDFELRTAIVLIKAKEKNIEIDIEAAKLISTHVSDSRALEGTLLSLYTKTLGTKDIIDGESTLAYFTQQAKNNIVKVSPNDVIKTICSYYQVRPSHLRGNTRITPIILPRQLAMYVLRNSLGLRLEEVAYHLKRRDHTTVMHGVEKISRLLTKDQVFKKEVDQLLQSLNLSA